MLANERTNERTTNEQRLRIFETFFSFRYVSVFDCRDGRSKKVQNNLISRSLSFRCSFAQYIPTSMILPFGWTLTELSKKWAQRQKQNILPILVSIWDTNKLRTQSNFPRPDLAVFIYLFTDRSQTYLLLSSFVNVILTVSRPSVGHSHLLCTRRSSHTCLKSFFVVLECETTYCTTTG